MVQNPLNPILGNNTKSAVIQTLTEKQPQTIKELHNNLQKHLNKPTTYQATHKTITEMLNETILEKTLDKKIQINKEWVNAFNKNAEIITKSTLNGEKQINLNNMADGETLQLKFSGILEVGWFLVDKLMVAPNPKNTLGIALWRFCYSIVGLEEKHLTGLKKACKQNKWYAFVEENNKLDHVFGDTLVSYGLKDIKYGIKCATPLSDKMIIGDYVAEIIYPSLFRKLWSIQNRLPVKVIEFNLGKHFLLMRDNQPEIELIITKNPKMAEEYRKEYIKLIKKRS